MRAGLRVVRDRVTPAQAARRAATYFARLTPLFFPRHLQQQTHNPRRCASDDVGRALASVTPAPCGRQTKPGAIKHGSNKGLSVCLSVCVRVYTSIYFLFLAVLLLKMAAIGMVQMLIEAAEYLDRREREAEHGYASMLPFTSSKERDSLKRKSKIKKNSSSRSTHNEMEKNRRAHLRLCLERLKSLVPLGPESNRHTTLSLLMKAKEHIKRLEESERKAQYTIDHLQREQRHLRRRLEQLGVERTRMDSMGSTISSEKSDSEQEELDVDVEGTDYLLGDLEWSSSSTDTDTLPHAPVSSSTCPLCKSGPTTARSVDIPGA
uniref:BHLH domain-containing protein n=1 Tax=Denticeps clupeoides TaxID=299321 RepID=A0AAY4BBJ0_9TELE